MSDLQAGQPSGTGQNKHSYLLLGPGMLTNPFVSEDEARAFWYRHRSTLMAECPPGQRPYAYFRFDLEVENVGRWFDGLKLLIERNLIDEAEAAQIEKNNPLLAADQPPALYSQFKQENGSPNPGALSSNLQERSRDLDRDARKFEAVAAFHGLRNRGTLQQIYSDLAIECRASIAGMTTQWLQDLNEL